MNTFNLRVYGWVFHPEKGVLLSEERGLGREFVKFPGGGVDLGEGPLEALKREFLEETRLTLTEVNPLYVTEECVPSSFDDSQVVAIYYEVLNLRKEDLMNLAGERNFGWENEEYIEYQRLFWVEDVQEVATYLTFEMDKKAWKTYLNR